MTLGISAYVVLRDWVDIGLAAPDSAGMIPEQSEVKQGAHPAKPNAPILAAPVNFPTAIQVSNATRDIFQISLPPNDEVRSPEPYRLEPKVMQDSASTKHAPRYVYGGRMVTPDGQEMLWLRISDVIYPVAIGRRLDETFVIKDITTRGIELEDSGSGEVWLVEAPSGNKEQ
ncbi:hypothetical protein [Rubrivivax gelatinosus]|uniref:hypothetical protein n=1 Tax=Rubrivivax gelatinosus TaxID=28068 RepID=UPI00104BBB47|nr:hypothetical protein [Rubrivivax gelatinosus]